MLCALRYVVLERSVSSPGSTFCFSSKLGGKFFLPHIFDFFLHLPDQGTRGPPYAVRLVLGKSLLRMWWRYSSECN
jgi:hypothetical protein